MATSTAERDLSITAAALRLKLGYWRVRDAILRGELVGFKDSAGNWRVTPDSLARFAKRSNGNG